MYHELQVIEGRKNFISGSLNGNNR